MKEQHILFINMPIIPLSKLIKGTTRRAIRTFPFGILYLSAVLKKQNHQGHIACVDYLIQNPESFAGNLDEFIISEAVKAISPHDPDVLAFSFSMSTSHEFFCRRLPLLKKIWPRANLECNFADNYALQAGNYNKALELFRCVAKLYPFHIFAWDGIRRAEQLAGNENGVQVAKQKIKELVLNDSRSRELLEKYGDLFPEVVKIYRSS